MSNIDSNLICSVCGKTFSFNDIMSSDTPMCDECAEKEWQENKKSNKQMNQTGLTGG